MGLRWVAIFLLLGVQAVSPSVAGTDAASGISYALLSVNGKLVGGERPDGPPRLTAQCTKDAAGKLRFELLADAGGVGEVRFVAPFKPTRDQTFPPRLAKVSVTMEFLGYMKVKPVKRQWTAIDGLADEWKYATPGMNSANMEEIKFYLQYLRALPTLRLTLPGAGLSAKPVVVEFETAAWQARVKAEPLCWASSL